MSDNLFWAGLAVGAVIGGGAGDDVPAGDGGDGLGGAKNVNNDDDSGNGGQGLFSLWGHEVWLYVGGIVGVGKSAGLYFTTGPMIGSNPDWAVGGGFHLARAFGLGMVIPVRQAYKSYEKHQDKIAMLGNQAGHYLDQASGYLGETVATATNFAASNLEQMVSLTNMLT